MSMVPVAPAPEEQLSAVKELIDSGSELLSVAATEDTFYVIDLGWFGKWKQHVDFNGSGKNGPSPGPIDNRAIAVDGQRLNNPSGMNQDFDIVSERYWNKLVEWYSMEPNSPVLKRTVVSSGGSNIVEVSAPVFDLWEANPQIGAAGARVPGNAQVVANRGESLANVYINACKIWLEAHNIDESDTDDITETVRLWYSLTDAGEEAAAGAESKDTKNADEVESKTEADAPNTSQWMPFEFENMELCVADLQIGDRNVVTVRAPKILIETRPSISSPWVFGGEPGVAAEAAAAASDAAAAKKQTAAASKPSAKELSEADGQAVAAAKAKTDERLRAADLPDGEWRAGLQVGSECDCFDGKVWRESVVSAVAAEGEDLDDIKVRFRNSGPDHELATKRSAGATIQEGSKAGEGALAKPYSHVSDWRAQLRQDMKIEMVSGTQHHYRNEETGTSLHWVGNATRYNEWWVSDHVGAKSHSRRGYLNVEGPGDAPPLSKDKEWELWTAVPGAIWSFTDLVQVTLEGGTPGKENIRIAADPEVLKKAFKPFGGKPEKFSGLFVRQPDATWSTRKVVRVDYQKRLVTLAKPYSYSYGSYLPARNSNIVVSLDSDTIRELPLGVDADDDLGLTGVDDVRERLDTTVAGLRNMGNTCFMNSVLQSLFALTPLVHFFADGAAVEEQLNTENFLGTGGKLARAFTALLRKVAACGGSVVERAGALGNFKSTLGNFAPVFAGYQQQDAMEFFNQFTSLIHEDCNRVKKKPYVEDFDDEGNSDEHMANESWRRYQLRNDSVIVDLVQGQFRSHLTCPNPDCGYESRRFDPFSAVACPLPRAPKKITRKSVRLFTLASITGEPRSEEEEKRCPLTFSTVLKCPLEGQAVAELLSAESGIPVNRLLVVESYQGKVFRVIFDTGSRVNLRFASRDHIIAFELPKDFDPKTQRMLELRFLGSKEETPLLIPVDCTETTTRKDIHSAAEKFLARRTIQSVEDLEASKLALPPVVVGDRVTWGDEGEEGKSGKVRAFRVGYGQVPTKVTVLVDGMSGYTIDKLPEKVTHLKDFKQLAHDYLSKKEKKATTADNDEEPCLYKLSCAEVETYTYQKSPAASPWKKPKMAKYDIKDLPADDKCCPTIACVIVDWARDLSLVASHKFDIAFAKPAEWSKDAGSKANEEEAIPEELSLHNSLRQHMMREQLGENDEWYCRGCKSHVRAYKKMDIWRLPPLLVFQLKRFSYEVGQWSTYREKLDSYVEFPFEIDMAPYVLGKGGAADETEAGITTEEQAAAASATQSAPAAVAAGAVAGGKGGKDDEGNGTPSMLYELVAVSNHMGGLGGGHYTAYAKRGNTWYDCNDSSTREVKPSSVRTSQAYVLFYRRVDANRKAAAAAAAAAEQDSKDVGAEEVETKSAN